MFQSIKRNLEKMTTPVLKAPLSSPQRIHQESCLPTSPPLLPPLQMTRMTTKLSEKVSAPRLSTPSLRMILLWATHPKTPHQLQTYNQRDSVTTLILSLVLSSKVENKEDIFADVKVLSDSRSCVLFNLKFMKTVILKVLHVFVICYDITQPLKQIEKEKYWLAFWFNKIHVVLPSCAIIHKEMIRNILPTSAFYIQYRQTEDQQTLDIPSNWWPAGKQCLATQYLIPMDPWVLGFAWTG